MTAFHIDCASFLSYNEKAFLYLDMDHSEEKGKICFF